MFREEHEFPDEIIGHYVHKLHGHHAVQGEFAWTMT